MRGAFGRLRKSGDFPGRLFRRSFEIEKPVCPDGQSVASLSEFGLGRIRRVCSIGLVSGSCVLPNIYTPERGCVEFNFDTASFVEPVRRMFSRGGSISARSVFRNPATMRRLPRDICGERMSGRISGLGYGAGMSRIEDKTTTRTRRGCFGRRRSEAAGHWSGLRENGAEKPVCVEIMRVEITFESEGVRQVPEIGNNPCRNKLRRG